MMEARTTPKTEEQVEDIRTGNGSVGQRVKWVTFLDGSHGSQYFDPWPLLFALYFWSHIFSNTILT